MTALQALKSSISKLDKAKISEPEAKAKVIVSHVLGIQFSEILNYADISDNQKSDIEAMTQKCMAGEPVEYVTGKAYFRNLTLSVSKDILIPRRETELVAGHAIDMIKQNAYDTAIDICTGSGCIAISIATETSAAVHATDISKCALKTAAQNAAQNGADDKIKFFISDMFDSLYGAYDIIVCNPPYVSQSEYERLDKSVKEYEPKLALVAGDGLDFYRNIAKNTMRYINPGGALVLEIGASQAEQVMHMLKANGFIDIVCKKDYEGRDRIVAARKK